MVLTTITEGITREIERTGDRVNSMFEPVLRLGVTGLSRAGKTVFITSLVANLLDRGRMNQLTAASGGRILAAWLQPHPDDTVPRFDYEARLAALTGVNPHWPEGTASVSKLRLSFRIQPGGILGSLSGPRTLHLDIMDYPGEWLTDLTLLEQSYSEWSEQTLSAMKTRGQGANFLTRADALAGAEQFEEPQAKELARLYTDHLQEAREAGYSLCTPGRFLMPGDLAGAPALSFAPLPVPGGNRPARRSLWREMERRFEAYKNQISKPFFQTHFSGVDRQVVLVDALGAIHRGPAAVDDMREAMAGILKAFKPGGNGLLSWLWRSKRVEKILFAATRADLLHHSQHPRLTAIMEALVRDAKDRADFAGAQTEALSIAALRTTVEETHRQNGDELDCVRGLRAPGQEALFYAGDLPADPNILLSESRDQKRRWLAHEFDAMEFLPAPDALRPGSGPPHIRLDKAAQFLIGDRL
ncbi:YcjX family protein [Thalassobius sp. I31.1]|uniref:YcjX family protein n=1 Tax=Thalassobius sp. I31.1 TaxID=2109912 RepID=UPI000D1B98BB|nr:YcjX family protein [Thalassobius sp. I31.1]